MERDLLRYLPLEIVTNILSRLSIENIGTCKCVCKPWLNLIESDPFVKSHLSKSAPALAVCVRVNVIGLEECAKWFNVLKLEDNHDLITKFEFPQPSAIQGSANGLLLLKNPHSDCFHVCNPITREFAEFHGPRCSSFDDGYGFGVNKISGQHKVVYCNAKYGFHVYTLETGSSWRCVEAVAPLFDRLYHTVGALISGNLHWVVQHGWGIPYVCCFDLETERFSTFYLPATNRQSIKPKLYTFGDHLCFRDDKEDDDAFWLLKEYEHPEKGWSKVLFNMKEPYYSLSMLMKGEDEDAYKFFFPIKVYRDGDMLILWDQNSQFFTNSIFLTPSLLSLERNLGLDNVISF
ncbi:F-box protein CPR1-like [Salvia hispanica]|uniref:F-box protein CPR1-like n=1 Tax=Salvia hispanica TaxID=49212 RepID=UPI002009B256|nr:F-box protein CPR1-like [Salvia hispanica]